MRRFLYYFKGIPGINPKMMAERGVLDRFEGSGGAMLEHQIAPINDGPAGHGCLVALGSQPPFYKVTGQTWAEGEKFWVGIEGAAPRPGDLAREFGISGYETVLGDGCSWRIPLIHRWDEERAEHVANLPKSMTQVMKDGKAKCEIRIKREFEGVNAIAERVFLGFAGEKTLPLDSVLADAAAILAVNYRIGIEEAGLLGLFDEVNAVRVLGMAIDLPKIQAQAEALATQGVEYVEPEQEE